ncbi:M28 family metallopeptidase, partial [Aeromicrobium sp.]|uniref:M28 family metallopeptidase n=1 Tax=Aeromicrobium sp. TaxID=1871063 RepID=UPI002FCB2E04
MGGLTMRTTGMVLVVVLASSCTSGSPEPAPTTASSDTSPAPATTSLPPPSFEVRRVLADIGHLADDIGPRHATSRAYAQAAEWVEDRFERLGYAVSRQAVDAPAGNTWGVDVPAGNSPNVIADPPGFDPSRPHRVVGAHLDTVPVAPGAEDNASGVSVMLELARVHADDDRPVRFIAFGAEEPRGPGDDLHHFGSQAFVRSLGRAERDAMRAMVSLDRVGVRGPQVPICHGGRGPVRARNQLAAVARRTQTPHRVCGDNRTSDHWSFERAGLPAARLGSVPYAGYHSRADTTDVISEGQIRRVGRIMV